MHNNVLESITSFNQCRTDAIDQCLLFMAILDNRSDCVEMLAKRGYIDTILTDTDRTPLHLACSHGADDVVQVLLQYGASVTARTTSGETPLHLATSAHIYSERILDLLLEHSAPVNVVCSQGKTPLSIAYDRCWWKGAIILRKSVDRRFNNDSIRSCTPQSEEDTENIPIGPIGSTLVRSLAKKFNNIKLSSGTPLHEACFYGTFFTVKKLVEGGSDVNATTTNGETPLHAACAEGHVEIVRYLLQNCSYPNATTLSEGYAPLHLAANEEIAKLLIDYGAYCYLKSNDGMTPLRHAKATGVDSVFAFLASFQEKLRKKQPVMTCH